MTGFTLALVLVSALAHASWNLLAKRAGGGPAFTWLFHALSVAASAPLVLLLLLLQRPPLGVVEVGFMVGSAALHLVYFLLLGRGYRAGDLSLVYPLARGTGPLLAALAVSPVSYVAPAREIGILVGAAMGSRLLKEGEASRRLAGAAAMVLGVVAIALG